jgi:hypothetical protein
MILLGDIACPNEACSVDLADVFQRHWRIFRGKQVILNLEGMVSETDHSSQPTPILFNHPSTIGVLERANTVVAAMANNHTLDLPSHFGITRKLLANSGIRLCGTGNSRSEADSPARFDEDGFTCYLFNSCWDFLLYHQKNPSANTYVSELEPNRLLGSVEAARQSDPQSKIIVYLHWNFDLEILPFPLHRLFARSLIDAGANLVIGTHSHCVQGGEAYNDGWIVYGLGNFFLPERIFANGNLYYPDFAKTELVCEWDLKRNDIVCHWFRYHHETSRHKLTHLESAPFDSSRLLEEYTPYRDMPHSRYRDYFRKHRRKRILVPIFFDHQQVTRNRIATGFLKIRGRVARSLARTRLRSWTR